MKNIIAMTLAMFCFMSVAALAASPGGPRLGSPGGGPVIDKSGDIELQKMIKDLLPAFDKLQYTDAQSGLTISYNLFSPQNLVAGEKYPLVIFIADASTPGKDVERPITQGYGALVWATSQWQKTHPCYVLVPQFSGVAVNDAYERTPEVNAVMRLLEHVTDSHQVDRRRLYATGQSMGGMISMYYNIAFPDIFAASIFVDCHWDKKTFDELARATFTFITAGKTGKAFDNIQALEAAATKDGRKFAYAEWSARLPEEEQYKLANDLLAKGAPINIINFTPKSVLPQDGNGSEHMYSFDYAYKLLPVREWLFRQAK